MPSLKSRYLALALGLGASHPAAAQEPAIDLKLFGKHEIEGGLSTCHLAFWQSNKNPDTDKYAYLIYMPYDQNGMPTHKRQKQHKKQTLACYWFCYLINSTPGSLLPPAFPP